MVKVLAILNGVLVVAFAVAWGNAFFLVGLEGAMRVTELDRAGVINEDRLREYDPELASNLRYNVGHWIAEESQSAATMIAIGGMGASLVNCVALGYLTRRGRKPESAGPNGTGGSQGVGTHP